MARRAEQSRRKQTRYYSAIVSPENPHHMHIILATKAQPVHGAGPRTKDLYETIPTCMDLYIANSQHNFLPAQIATKAPPTHPTSNPTPNSPRPKLHTPIPCMTPSTTHLPTLPPTTLLQDLTPLSYPHSIQCSTHSRPSSLPTHTTWGRAFPSPTPSVSARSEAIRAPQRVDDAVKQLRRRKSSISRPVAQSDVVFVSAGGRSSWPAGAGTLRCKRTRSLIGVGRLTGWDERGGVLQSMALRAWAGHGWRDACGWGWSVVETEAFGYSRWVGLVLVREMVIRM